MNFKRNLGDFNHFIIRAFTLIVSLLILLSFAAYSNENSYQLTKVAELEHKLISQPHWKQIIVNPSNKQQHFVIRESGQIYLIDDDKIEPQAILDMSVFQQKDSSLFKLTAIELHPNFSLRNQFGYSTFYTAHIETINKNTKTKRLQERGDDLQLSFDAVITEWQFSSINHKKVDVNTKREVLRIGVPDNLMVIKQMSFNPNIKSWNDDFGLLYVALNGGEEWPQPLYSGAVLRIDPAKFGLRSFSVPKSNPYMKNSQINDVIYVLGGQKITQFIWPGKNSEHILVSHQYNNKYLLSLTDGRNDWRQHMSKQVLYQSEHAVHDMLVYQGRELSLLRSKLLLLRQEDQHWFIDSLAFNFSDNQKIRNEKKPQLEWPITSHQLPIHSQIILSSNHYGEIFLLEKTINFLFRLTQQALVNDNVVAGTVENNSIEQKSADYSFFILLFILGLIVTIYYWFKLNVHSAKRLVRQQFASLELNESCHQVSLYQRHQKNAETIIDIVNIVSIEITLNGHSVSVVNEQLDHGFNHDKDQDLRTLFVNEKVDKMVEGKIRQISLLLTDNRKNSYTVCLYMRKGSDRITKKPYVKVINELIDWCWLIGETINPDNMGKRKVKPTILAEETTDIQSTKNNKNPLHNKAEAIRPVRSQVADEVSSTLDRVNDNNHLAELAGDESNKVHNQIHQENTIDTELINALEKLVNLKQQGFLTMDEFSKAKENLLKGLFDK
jgi:hypothetical protein